MFAFPSEYEGFGLTPLEALARGVPPVVLDTPIAREIYGGAARYVRADLHRHQTRWPTPSSNCCSRQPRARPSCRTPTRSSRATTGTERRPQTLRAIEEAGGG